MGNEHPRSGEYDRDILRAFVATFINRHDCYPKQLPDGAYVKIDELLTYGEIVDHLRGKATIGAYALDARSHAKWICFDADDEARFAGLQALAKTLTSANVPSYLELSRRGGHLWLFTPPLPGKDARRFGAQLLKTQRLVGIELYPKQDKLQTGPGSQVRLPLGVHRRSGKIHPFIDLAGNPLAATPRQLLPIMCAPQRVPQAFIEGVLAAAPEPKPAAAISKKTRRQIEGLLPTEKIKAVPIREFISAYRMELDNSNRGYCPFHDDQRKSFAIYPDTNTWHCFAGCKGATALDFAIRWRELQGQNTDWNTMLRETLEMLGL